MRGIALALTFLPYPSFVIAGVIEGIVVNVIDSDTITVLDVNKQQHRIRIAGIDATEKCRPFDNASTKRVGESVARGDVLVEFDKNDHYGRIVGKALVRQPECPTCD